MKLELERLGVLSSWASVLMAYEGWILADNQPARRALAAGLVSAVPAHLDRSPSPEFTAIVDLAATELSVADEFRRSQETGEDAALEAYHQFWARTLPVALQMRVAHSTISLSDAYGDLG